MRNKPSIFSKNYKKKLRRRRRRIITAVVIGIAVIIVGGVYLVNNVNIKSAAGEKEGAAQEVGTNIENQATDGGVKENTDDIMDGISSEEFTLESGNKVTITYKEDNGSQKVQMIDGGHSVKSNISPSGDSVFLCDTDTKDIYIIGADKQVNKITNPKYVASGNGGVFLKDAVMASNKEYKWVDDGMYIDDTHIAYSSALPWFNKDNQLYLWIYDVSSGTHKGCFSVNGKEFKFEEAGDDGLKLLVDGVEVVVNGSGNIVQ